MGKLCIRGDIFYADLGPGYGSEQHGCRPVLIIQNNIGNKYSPTVIVAIITSKIDMKTKLPTHYPLDAKYGLQRPSLVLLEQIRTVDKRRLDSYIGHVNILSMREIDYQIKTSLALNE